MVKTLFRENVELLCELRVQVSSFWEYQRIMPKKWVTIKKKEKEKKKN